MKHIQNSFARNALLRIYYILNRYLNTLLTRYITKGLGKEDFYLTTKGGLLKGSKIKVDKAFIESQKKVQEKKYAKEKSEDIKGIIEMLQYALTLFK